MRLLTWIPLLFFVACGGGEDASDSSGEGAASTSSAPTDRDAWWKGATRRPSGAERVLAPRELRAVLANGRRHGFDGDAAWWEPNAKWAYARILALDSDDVEANSAMGRKTLQSIPGFAELWKRIGNARVYNPAMEELLDQYAMWIAEERPVFLTEDEYQIVLSKFRIARAHLDRMEKDPEYAALQIALERVPSQLRDYPSVRARAGPFLLFLAAPDLRRIEGESEESENERLATLRERYTVQLAEHAKVLDALLSDIRELYPDLAQRHPIRPDAFFFVWIFTDPGWYRDFVSSIARARPESKYRSGFFNRKDMWSYVYVPRPAETVKPKDGEEPADDQPDPTTQLRETLAYVGAQQLLRHWARDPADRFSNRLDKSRAYWLKEGWPTFLAARRVKKPSVGPALDDGWRFGRAFPELRDIVQRESRLELFRFQEAAPEVEEGAPEPVSNFGLIRHFTDLSWLFVRHLNGDARRKAFEQFLLSQIEATSRGDADALAEALGLENEGDWVALEGAVYDAIEGG